MSTNTIIIINKLKTSLLVLDKSQNTPRPVMESYYLYRNTAL